MPLVVSIGVIGACCLLCVCARVPLLYRQLCADCAVRGCRRVGGRSQVRGWRQLFQSRRRGPAGSLGRRASELLRRSGTAEQHGTDKGQLNEDVSGANIAVNGSAGITAPADVTPSATSYPVGVIYDADGSVIDSIFGATTSTPEACQQNGVFVWRAVQRQSWQSGDRLDRLRWQSAHGVGIGRSFGAGRTRSQRDSAASGRDVRK